MLKESFISLLTPYTNSPTPIDVYWSEIEKNYTKSKRYYHSLTHLERVLFELLQIKQELKNWDAVLFALFYHDLVYNITKTDNEEKSAEIACKRMRQISVTGEIIELSKTHILATKHHEPSENTDVNYFTDADLSILGQPWDIYSQYCKNIRKEYLLYPNILYNPGRKNVLFHFLKKKSIFKTNYFRDRYEAQAQLNLQQELQQL